MMDERQTKMLASVALVLFVLFIAYKRAQLNSSSQPVADAAAAPNTSPVISQDSGTTPGTIPAPWYMNNSAQPIATPTSIQASITVNPWQVLNQNYMPLFGFVGMAS